MNEWFYERCEPAKPKKMASQPFLRRPNACNAKMSNVFQLDFFSLQPFSNHEFLVKTVKLVTTMNSFDAIYDFKDPQFSWSRTPFLSSFVQTRAKLRGDKEASRKQRPKRPQKVKRRASQCQLQCNVTIWCVLAPVKRALSIPFTLWLMGVNYPEQKVGYYEANISISVKVSPTFAFGA